ncbi:hypothetical protein A2U01_0068151, partial [Trifolium medium]|nr:hypothetical protein [Trifolium medium]
ESEQHFSDNSSCAMPETQPKVLQQVDNTTLEAVELAQKNATLNDASACAIPKTTQKVVIVSDDDFDEVVIADLQVLKQVLAD